LRRCRPSSTVGVGASVADSIAALTPAFIADATALAQAAHDDTYAVAQAYDDLAHGESAADYNAQLFAAEANLLAAQGLAASGFDQTMETAAVAQITSDADATLSDAKQVADALLGDATADDGAIDGYSKAESDDFDSEQKNDAQALDTQQTTDASAYAAALAAIDQSTPWGAQAAAQAQAQATLEDALAGAQLTLTDAEADAADAEEKTQADAERTQSDALAQLVHDLAYADAQSAHDQSIGQAALAAIDGYFGGLPDAPDDGWGNPGWGEGAFWQAIAPSFFSDYGTTDEVDDISASGQGWSWSVGGTTAPSVFFGGIINFG
jgi:hypothetical protein